MIQTYFSLIETQPRLNIVDQIDRFFCMLAYMDARADFDIKISGIRDERLQGDSDLLASWLECTSDSERNGVVDLLIQNNYLRHSANGYFNLTPSGIAKFSEVQKSPVNSKQAFIAMWFDSSMDEIATNGIEIAIRAAGYSPMRIDKKEHNNKIDDEIVAEIKRSRFIVADFTCGKVGENPIARGGVYFEAGFALGLGLPVIWCCRSDMIDLVHFDTRQFSHVTWSTSQELAKKLYDRICAVIGETDDAPGLQLATALA